MEELKKELAEELTEDFAENLKPEFLQLREDFFNVQLN